ncbi:MAG: DUF2326 domain-containing protein [Gammaproteobacteria bacterium]|nr:DUF2326 domain-containing protein [Gammaproteobacteria bacterium]
MIRLIRLYSNPEIFSPMEFERGVNIILGEKVDSRMITGRKTNGVGKSMCIEFINFCLLKKTRDSRVMRIPVVELDEQLEKNGRVIKSFGETVLKIHELIMGNKTASFNIATINKDTAKEVVNFEMRIFDDGSHGVDRTKVFIYDTALMFNEHTRQKHPGLLIHDNIFDVDQDTLVQSLNFLAKQEELYDDFQYILTLNRDKIENEERQKLIRLDIETHQRAKFTKESKFLKKDYQELSHGSSGNSTKRKSR